jgi:hypothetical protein
MSARAEIAAGANRGSTAGRLDRAGRWNGAEECASRYGLKSEKPGSFGEGRPGFSEEGEVSVRDQYPDPNPPARQVFCAAPSPAEGRA